MRDESVKMNRLTKKIWFFLVCISIFFLLSFVVMMLWNSILPKLVHVGTLSYLQAIGLFLLCRLFFGRFTFGFRPYGRFGMGAGHNSLWKEKLSSMNPGDRDAFKQQWRAHCEKNKQAE